MVKKEQNVCVVDSRERDLSQFRGLVNRTLFRFLNIFFLFIRVLKYGNWLCSLVRVSNKLRILFGL